MLMKSTLDVTRSDLTLNKVRLNGDQGKAT